VLATECDHGHAAAGVDATTHEEEIAILRAALGSFEGEVFAAIADHTVDRAAVGEIALLDVERSPEIFNEDVFSEIGEAHAFELIEAKIFEGDVVFAGVRVLIVAVGDVGKNLDVVADGRRLGRIGAGGRDQIDRWVVGQQFLTKDTMEVALLVARVEEVVVGELGIGAVESEVEDDARARWLKALEFLEHFGWFAEEETT